MNPMNLRPLFTIPPDTMNSGSRLASAPTAKNDDMNDVRATITLSWYQSIVGGARLSGTAQVAVSIHQVWAHSIQMRAIQTS